MGELAGGGLVGGRVGGGRGGVRLLLGGGVACLGWLRELRAGLAGVGPGSCCRLGGVVL